MAGDLHAHTERLQRDADEAKKELEADEILLAQLKQQIEETTKALDRANQEEAFERGEGRYLRDFKTHKEFMSNKLAQLQQLTVEVQRQHDIVQARAGKDATQKAALLALHAIVVSKLSSMKDVEDGGLPKTAGERHQQELQSQWQPERPSLGPQARGATSAASAAAKEKQPALEIHRQNVGGARGSGIRATPTPSRSSADVLTLEN